jgi:DnaJ-domain-containing protein 1
MFGILITIGILIGLGCLSKYIDWMQYQTDQENEIEEAQRQAEYSHEQEKKKQETKEEFRKEQAYKNKQREKQTYEQANYNTQEEQNQQKQSNSNTFRDEKYYGRVLGLKGKTTKDDIKRSYRELVAQYHPDKVTHLGPKLKVLAEQEMKEINEAYAYLKKRYNIQ